MSPRKEVLAEGVELRHRARAQVFRHSLPPYIRSLKGS
jgi:hypothetical protein